MAHCQKENIDTELVRNYCKHWPVLLEKGTNFTFIYEGCEDRLFDAQGKHLGWGISYKSFLGYVVGKNNCIIPQLPEKALHQRQLCDLIDHLRYNVLHFMIYANKLECAEEIAQKFPFLLDETDSEGLTPIDLAAASEMLHLTSALSKIKDGRG